MNSTSYKNREQTKNRRSGPGARPLACNQWLEEQLAAFREPGYPRALYRPWLERYRALRGFYPQDPRRSFRAAVVSARNRLRRATHRA